MKDSLIRRYVILACCFLFSLYLIAPTLWRFFPLGERPGIFLSEGLNLGLDLQGGIHLTMQVQVEEALKKNAESRAVDISSRLKQGGVTVTAEPTTIMAGGLSATTFTFASAAERDRARTLLEEQYADVNLSLEGDTGLLLRGNVSESQALRSGAVDRALEILRSRIDQFGVAEPVLVREGADRLVIQLPGLKDQERALKLIGTTAQLEFRIVHDRNGELQSFIQAARTQGKLQGEPTEQDYREALKGLIPADSTLAFQQPIKEMAEGVNLAALNEPPQPILLRNRIEMTGEAVTDARTSRDPQSNEPNVQVSLSPSAARDFEELTAQNVNKQLAIVLDGKVKSAPNIQERIGGGQVRITGQFSDVEAADLAMVLRSGALPAPIKVIQNISVGASLGYDSIRAGLLSGGIGFVLVCFFMIFYYGTAGWIANSALVLNNTMLLGALAALNATLTLPGIAGIVLSMGMAVDSNVLIYERMRDELELGRSVSQAIRNGFDKAWWTIFDSHVTTLLTALVLFIFGTGPIKGFAVTLVIGVSLNLFTALFGTRVIYDHMLMRSSIRRISFRQLMRKQNIDFIGLRSMAFAFSALFTVGAIVALVQIQAGKANLGIDFAGGTMITLSSSTPFSVGDARTVLTASGFGESEVQTAEGSGQILIRLREVEENPGDLTGKVVAGFKQAHPDQTFKVEGAEVIGSAVSQDLRDASLMAILFSLLGIVGYLSLRFDFRFGVAAALATFHDVLFVLAIFYVTDRQINLLFVTALLTIAGYSLTDTVVIFDRLREIRQRFPDMDIGHVVNTAINEVLSRTLITSTTVLLVLVALLLWGGAVLFDFSLALLLGVLIGTYSSIFVASPILYEWEMRRGRLEPEADKPRTFQDSVGPASPEAPAGA